MMFIGIAALLLVSVSPVTGTQEAARTLIEQDVRQIVFAERTFVGDGHWYANFGYHFAGPEKKLYGEKGRLCILDLASTNVAALIDDPGGAVRDPQVHYDAEKILFSYRKGGTAQYHLYEINVDGSGLKQLTDGIYDDIEPTYLPDGGIMFVSARSKRWVNCWIVQVGNLYRCDKDGKNVQVISCNIEQDNTPWVLPDGRVLFTRWEYVDRSQVSFHHLWTCNQDGTDQKVYFGNMHPGGLFIDAKPIPGSDRVVYINSPGHGAKEHRGHVATVTDIKGPDAREQSKNVTKGREFRDPYAVTDKLFLAARHENEVGLVDEKGEFAALFKSNVPVHEPRPLVRRMRERVIPPRIDRSKSTGTLILSNAYLGRNMEGVEPGEIKKLLILETLPKPLNYGGGLHDFIPISHGGTFTIPRILGTVPVEEDGSAHFEVPANRPLFLIALDEKNQSVKRMHSFLSVMPGEVLSCVGCHEQRVNTPQGRPAVLKAMKRKASIIEKVPGIPFTIDFPRDIQPILDKHCIKCHNPDKPDGKILLTGDPGPVFSHAYFSLAGMGYVSDGRNRHGNTPPRGVGDSASKLMKMLDGSHHKAKLSHDETEMIRNWIHIGATYPGTYAALGTGMVRTDKPGNNWMGNLSDGVPSKETMTAQKEAHAVFGRTCAKCHGGQKPSLAKWSIRGAPKKGRYFFDSHLAFNLAKPDKSAILLAPLAKEAGGWGECRAKNESEEQSKAAESLFRDKNNADYGILLAWIEAGKRELEKNKRWDMPGFKPHPYYVREMIRYGILPETFDNEKHDVDVFELERKYFEASWYYPDGRGPKLYKNREFNQRLQVDIGK